MKRKLLSIILALLLILNPLIPCQETPTVSAENVQTLSVEDKKFYNKLKSGFTPASAVQYNDQNQTVALDMDAVTNITLNLSGVNMTEPNKSIVTLLFQECTQLKTLRLSDCDLSTFSDDDFSGLNNRNSLTTLCLVNCKLEQFPAVTLPELTAMCLTSNLLSTDDACKNISADHLPKLSSLYLDGSWISEISFLEGLGTLKTLSIGESHLTDDSLSTLLDMNGSIPDLVNLNLGVSRHEDIFWGSKKLSAGNSTNTIDNTGNLALLATRFPKLKELDLSGLRITSLQDFVGIRDDISIDFQKNKLTDFAGFEKRNNFNFDYQEPSLPYRFAAGWENEIPELMKRVMDENDALHGSLIYTECSLSDDGKRIVIPSNHKGTPYVTVGSFVKLDGTKFTLYLKELNPPAITEDLTAHEGDTLAQLALPDGYAWQNPAQDIGTAGPHTFPADCTVEDEGHTYIKYGIDIPVTVLSDADPTPTPTVPASETASPTPAVPTPTPIVPTQTPEIASPTPTVPTQTPEITSPTPTKVPATLTPTPTKVPTPTKAPATLAPTPTKPPISPSPVKTPTAPTQAPITPAPIVPAPTPTNPPSVPTSAAPAQTQTIPTFKPDESGLTGNQIEKRKDLSLLLATGIQTGKHRIKLTWREKNGCSGYEVYWSFCDGKQNFKKLKTVEKDGKRECFHTQLQKDRAYKYYIATYTIQDGRKNYQSKSPSIHIAMKKEAHTNAKRIKVNQANVTLKETGTFQIKATAVLENRKKKLLNHEKKFRYYVDNQDVASVNQKGKILAKSKGTCTVFVITNNGVAKQIRVAVE